MDDAQNTKVEGSKLYFTVDRKLHESLKAQAKREYRSVAGLLRAVCTEYLCSKYSK